MRGLFVVACLLAGLLVGAIWATGASAALPMPVWAECAKAVPSNSGDYTGKTCSEASEPGKGAYVLREGLGKDKEFKGKAATPAVHWQSWPDGDCEKEHEDCKIICKSSKMSGKYALPNLEMGVQLALSGCASSGNKEVPCSSPGAKEAEIKFKPLRGELGYVEESPITVGLKLESQASPGGPLLELYCGGSTSPSKHRIHEVLFKTTLEGAIIGVQEGNVNRLNKGSMLSDVSIARGPEQEISWELDGGFIEHVEYEPIVNILGWAAELPEIETRELPPDVLSGRLCGQSIEETVHAECAETSFMGLDQAVAVKGEALMVKT